MDDFFAELEAEISTAMEKVKIRKDAEAAKKKAHNMRLAPATRLEAGKVYKELSAVIEADQWAARATIALFTEQTCDGCGSVHRVFLQFMELQVLKHRPTTQRYVRVGKPAPRDFLPREVMIQPHHTHVCYECCEDHGFDPSLAAQLQTVTSAAAPSATYFQEDINAEAA